MFQNAFQGHACCYPHSTAYRAITPTIPLKNAWECESLKALELYLHIPFNGCQQNGELETKNATEAALISKYLGTVEVQAQQIKKELSAATFGSLVIGGGSSTCLNIDHWKQVFRTLSDTLGVDFKRVPFSCRTSPSTVEAEKLVYLREQGVDRLSLAVQSLEELKASASGQIQDLEAVSKAIHLIRQAEFPVMNLDLFYGARDQGTESWLQMVDMVAHLGAEEVCLYPLYNYPTQGLSEQNQSPQLESQNDWDAQRLDAYRAARDYLTATGYEQISFRKFLRTESKSECSLHSSPSDGTIGLGAGARSHTRDLHYSFGLKCADDSTVVSETVNDYVSKSAEDFRVVQFGHHLNLEEQKRSFVISGLLRAEGVDTLAYEARFGSYTMKDFPQLLQLVLNGYMHWDDSRLQLTPSGLELSDAIGPWLYSAKVNSLMETYQCR